MAVSVYDEIAEWYDQWLGPEPVAADPLFPVVEALLGEVEGLRICDLACGQGRVARHLAERGAQVIGVDISRKLIEIGRRREDTRSRRVAYVQADAQGLDCIAESTFDGVICYLALMDIPVLEPAVRGIARVLRPGGWLVFAILHPCYNPPRSGELVTSEGLFRTVAGYWDEGYWRSEARTGPPGKVGSFHRTLSTYLNALTDAGLTIERTAEPPARGRMAEHRPVWLHVPAFLIVRCRKGSRLLAEPEAGHG